MTAQLTGQVPERTKTYVGPATHSAIWSDFQLRDNDIIVTTPPKCGTTWMQSIVMMLIFGKPGMDIGIGQISPWLDIAFRDQDEIVARLNSQQHRRCIKSHTPLDGITYQSECTYIAVYRHPLDVHFSMRTHVKNMSVDILDHLFPDDNIHTGFELFIKGELSTRGTDDVTIASIVHHYQSLKQWAHLPNIHLLHYADLKRDLPAEISRLASILRYDYSPELISELAQAASFETMQANAKVHRIPSRISLFKDPAKFFASGSSNKWEQYLSTGDIARYEARIAELLPEADIRWLENGST